MGTNRNEVLIKMIFSNERTYLIKRCVQGYIASTDEAYFERKGYCRRSTNKYPRVEISITAISWAYEKWEAELRDTQI